MSPAPASTPSPRRSGAIPGASAAANALRNGFVLSLLGALLLGAVGAWLIFGGSGSKPPSGVTAPPGSKLIQVSLRRGIYAQLGVELEQPTSWLTAAAGPVLRLSSPDNAAASLTVSDIGPAGRADALRRAINSQLVKALAPAKVIAQKHGPIGKIQAITTAIIATSRAKQQVLILSTAISSPHRTYSVQVVFKSLRPSSQSLLEVRNMLASFRFFAPTSG